MPAWAVLKRELLTSFRRTRTFLLVLGGAGIIFLYIAYFMLIAPYGRGSAGMPAAGFGGLVLRFLVGGLYSMAVVSIPALASAAIVTERQQGSYEMLINTLVTPAGITVAKLGHSLVIFLLVLVAILPLFGVVFFFTGVEWRQLIWSAALLAVGALALAATGLCCSVLARRERTAALLGYGGAGLFLGIIHLPSVLYMAENGLDTATFLFICVPVVSLGAVLGDVSSFSNGHFLLAVLYQAVWAAVFASVAAALLHRPWEPKHPTSRKRGPVRMFRRAPRGRADSWRFPVYTKELRENAMGKAGFRTRLFIVFFLFCLVLDYLVLRSDISFSGALVAQLAAMLLLAPSTVAGAFAREHEQGNVDMLRMSLLTPGQVTRGKLLAGASMVLPMFAASALAAFLFYMAGMGVWREFQRETGHLGLALAGMYARWAAGLSFMLCASLLAGAFVRRNSTAYASVQVFNVLLLFVLPSLIVPGLLAPLRDEVGIVHVLLVVVPTALFTPTPWPGYDGTQLLAVAAGLGYAALLFWGAAGIARHRVFGEP